MRSDNEDDESDWFEYNSSQNYSDIDYQIYLFEKRQSAKQDRGWKQIRNIPLCPISTRKLQAHAVSLKFSCKRYEQKPKIEQKSFGAQYYSHRLHKFDCDKALSMESTQTEPEERTKTSKKSNDSHVTDFTRFRDQFYRKHHQTIKSSLRSRSDIHINNIRPAPVKESAQIEFMKRLSTHTHSVPQLVYHGTKLQRIDSILRFGFLVPNQVHPTNKQAPIIQSVNGQVYGRGIYCSRTASYSVSYTHTSNTLLVCAAIPDCNQMGKVEYFGNILVLPDVAQIIPLFLMDFGSLDGLEGAQLWYPPGERL